MRSLILIGLLFSLLSCGYRSCEPPSIVKLNLIDQHGINQTIQAEERLATYQEIDFLSPQPYRKVLRVFATDHEGHHSSCITSYFENGQVRQYLDVKDGRPWGDYREWFESGQLALEAHVVGGIPDLEEHALKSFLFDGAASAWNEEGVCKAQLSYSRGELSGPQRYFHPNGTLWRELHYAHNLLEGVASEYFSDGQLRLQSHYVKGELEGVSTLFHPNGVIAAKEEFSQGALLWGHYSLPSGDEVAHVEGGEGERVAFLEDGGREITTYSHGYPNGWVCRFGADGHCKSRYQLVGGVKHGEEILYFDPPQGNKEQPHLSLHWHSGEMQGVMRSYYPDGQLESQKEMSQNRKNGLSMAWYRDGSLMMIEEYHEDRLIKGQYFSQGRSRPTSLIEEGRGMATLYDAEGHFLRKVPYFDGVPDLDAS